MNHSMCSCCKNGGYVPEPGSPAYLWCGTCGALRRPVSVDQASQEPLFDADHARSIANHFLDLQAEGQVSGAIEAIKQAAQAGQYECVIDNLANGAVNQLLKRKFAVRSMDIHNNGETQHHVSWPR